MIPITLLTTLVATLTIAGQFTTSLGDQYPYAISSIATDAAGNTYVVGSRQIGSAPTFVVEDFSTLSSIWSAVAQTDVFVSKIDPNGTVLFTDTFGGKGSDAGTAITLDPAGNIYIAGATTSIDFPLSKALQTQSNPTYGTGFIIKLSNDGSTILYSTYFGGMLGATSISSLATDAQGNLYLTGSTTAADFPHTSGMPFGTVQQGTLYSTISGAIIASISAAGDRIVYSGAIVASLTTTTAMKMPAIPAPTGGVGIAVDATGNAYVAGDSFIGGFVAKVNGPGNGLSYLTYLNSEQTSGSPGILLNAIAVDAEGNAYLAGSAGDLITTPGVLQPGLSGDLPLLDGFLAKLNPSGSAWIWATYLPGGAGATPYSIAIDSSGNVWTTGVNSAPGLPNPNGLPVGSSSTSDFLVGVNAAGSKLSYSSLFASGTVAQSVAVDPSGLVHVAGSTGFVSAMNPTGTPAMKIFDFQNAFGGNATARISPAEVISIYGPGIGPANAVNATPSGGFYPTTLAGVQVTLNGVNIPLLYVSADQINAVVPMEIAAGAATMRVINGTAVSAAFPVWIVAAAPQAFPTVLNQDGTINSPKNPAKSNSVVTFYATGWQSNFSPLSDGQVATTAKNECGVTCLVSIEGDAYRSPPTILYEGAAPTIVAGVTQINMNVGGGAGGSVAEEFSFVLINSSTLTVAVWIEP